MKMKYLAVALAAAFAMAGGYSAHAQTHPQQHHIGIAGAQGMEPSNNYPACHPHCHKATGGKSAIDNWQGRGQRGIEQHHTNELEEFDSRRVHSPLTVESEPRLQYLPRNRTIPRFPHPSHGGNQIFDRWGNI
jgi:hypothetical protein